MTAQMALAWGEGSMTTAKAPIDAGRTCRRVKNGIRGKRAPTTYGGDWSSRDDPLPDPSVLLRVGSSRCLCNNGCGHVFSSESAYERHLELRDDGSARCRTATELRALKRPMARDAAGVWFSPAYAQEVSLR
jgi:hypothetical protein